jgi:hypothetical protein
VCRLCEELARCHGVNPLAPWFDLSAEEMARAERVGAGMPDTAESLLLDRYVLDSDAPGPCPVRTAEPTKHYGVFDRRLGRHAILPDATLCWGMTIDRALDCLNELRGGMQADRAA